MNAQFAAALCGWLPLAGLPGIAAADQCALLSDLDGFVETRSGPAGADCSTYLTTTGTTGTSCNWKHDYRGEDSDTFAEELWQMIGLCRPGGQAGEENQVNHPDSYGLRTWQVGDAIYSVSVKDKARLNSTFVFLRFEPVHRAD